MPSLISTAVLFLYTLTALAAPFQQKRDDDDEDEERHKRHCLSKREAQQVATNYGNLIANYNVDLANAALSPDFTDFSESVNSLINGCPQGSAAVSLPLLAPTFSSRAQFELGQGQQAPINFQQLNIWRGCTSVTIRWETTNTAPIPNVQPVVGLIVMETVPAPEGNKYPYQISKVYSEFDAAAWLENIQAAGFCATNAIAGPKTNTTAAAKRTII